MHYFFLRRYCEVHYWTEYGLDTVHTLDTASCCAVWKLMEAMSTVPIPATLLKS